MRARGFRLASNLPAVFLTGTLCAIAAQPACPQLRKQSVTRSVEAIRARAREIDATLARKPPADAPGPPFHIAHFKMGDRDNRFAGVGQFQEDYTFYFSDEGGNNRLVKIAGTGNRAASRRYQEEIYFDEEGRPIFCYCKQRDSAFPRQPVTERRYYFAAGRPIRVIVDSAIKDTLAGPLLREAKAAHAHALFLKTFWDNSLNLLPDDLRAPQQKTAAGFCAVRADSLKR